VVAVSLKKGAALLLGPRLGHVGISWAVSIASVAQFCMLAVRLRKRLGPLGGMRILQTIAKSGGAALLAAGAALGSVQLSAKVATSHVVVGLVCCVSFAVVFLLAAWLLRSDELSTVLGPLRRRFGNRRQSK